RSGIRAYPFAVENPWFAGKISVASFQPEELFGTKLRVLLQRRKGRDLFDLHEGLKQLSLDVAKVVAAFKHCLAHEGTPLNQSRDRRLPLRNGQENTSWQALSPRRVGRRGSC